VLPIELLSGLDVAAASVKPCALCEVCNREQFKGWIPPTWINAVARTAEQIKRELYEARREHDRPTGLDPPA
jgi:hypothetical protein